MFFFFNDTATTEIYTLSLHDALPISIVVREGRFGPYVTDGETNASLRKGDTVEGITVERASELLQIDRKSTRLNSSHDQISYAVFCLKKKKKRTKVKVHFSLS